MGAPLGTLVATVILDAKGFDKGMKDVEKKLGPRGNVQKEMRGMRKAFAAPLIVKMGAVLGLAAFLKGINMVKNAFIEGINLAENFQRIVDNFDNVFQGNAEQMRIWAENFEEKLPVSVEEAMSALYRFQQQLTGMGFPEDVAIEMSKTLTEISGNFAALNNIDLDQMVKKVRSYMKGNKDALAELGHAVTNSQLKSRFAELFAGQNWETASELQQMITLFDLLEKRAQQPDVMGAAIRAAESLEGKLKLVNEEYERMLRLLSKGSIPFFVSSLEWAENMLKAMNAIIEMMDKQLEMAGGTEGEFRQEVKAAGDDIQLLITKLSHLFDSVGRIADNSDEIFRGSTLNALDQAAKNFGIISDAIYKAMQDMDPVKAAEYRGELSELQKAFDDLVESARIAHYDDRGLVSDPKAVQEAAKQLFDKLMANRRLVNETVGAANRAAERLKELPFGDPSATRAAKAERDAFMREWHRNTLEAIGKLEVEASHAGEEHVHTDTPSLGAPSDLVKDLVDKLGEPTQAHLDKLAKLAEKAEKDAAKAAEAAAKAQEKAAKEMLSKVDKLFDGLLDDNESYIENLGDSLSDAMKAHQDAAEEAESQHQQEMERFKKITEDAYKKLGDAEDAQKEAFEELERLEKKRVDALLAWLKRNQKQLIKTGVPGMPHGTPQNFRALLQEVFSSLDPKGTLAESPFGQHLAAFSELTPEIEATRKKAQDLGDGLAGLKEAAEDAEDKLNELFQDRDRFKIDPNVEIDVGDIKGLKDALEKGTDKIRDLLKDAEEGSTAQRGLQEYLDRLEELADTMGDVFDDLEAGIKPEDMADLQLKLLDALQEMSEMTGDSVEDLLEDLEATVDMDGGDTAFTVNQPPINLPTPQISTEEAPTYVEVGQGDVTLPSPTVDVQEGETKVQVTQPSIDFQDGETYVQVTQPNIELQEGETSVQVATGDVQVDGPQIDVNPPVVQVAGPRVNVNPEVDLQDVPENLGAIRAHLDQVMVG